MKAIREYDRNRRRYDLAVDTYERLLIRKEELFQRTQPQAIEIKPDLITGGSPGNPLEDYAVRVSEIDQKLAGAASLIESRKYLLSISESRLRASCGLYDRIYVARYLDGKSVGWISRNVNYSERQVYRVLRLIARNLERCQDMSVRA